MILTLIRHGQTEGSINDLYYGAADIPVLPESLAELHENAARYPTAKRYFTSGMLRTEQTFRAIYGDVPHMVLPGLREMDFGDFEMRSYEQMKDDPAFQHWMTDSEHLPCPNGESAPQTTARNLKAMETGLAEDSDAVCVIHGGVIAGFMMTWFGGLRVDWYRKAGTGYQVTFENGAPVSWARVPEDI